jgi:capsule biosynthesis phosphatase
MNIIIPLCGNGVRFSELGYKTPKPLIKCLGKPIIFWVIDNLNLGSDDVLIIPYNESLKEYCFEEEISNRYKNLKIRFKPLPNTKGAADTVFKTLDLIPINKSDDPILLIDGDTFYVVDIIGKTKMSGGNSIFYFIDYGSDPIFSYISLSEGNKVTDIKEKVKISNNANVGVYKFINKETFIKYFKELNQNDGEIYISNVYNKMLGKEIINGVPVGNNDFTCLGTPQQLKTFSLNKGGETRICFDLDNTLVTRPKISGDYRTVEPIEKNIKYLRHLNDSGCTIIIHTARRMITHNGNVGKILQDVGLITMETLEKFNIPYDELIFGKPYADFYIDDKSIDLYDDMEKQLGYYMLNENETRKFNNITEKTFSTIVKESDVGEIIAGEIYYYKNIPHKIKKLFPKLIDYGKNFYEIEKIDGLTFSSLLTSKILNENHLTNLLNVVEDIHSVKSNTDCNYIYNYREKVKNRYDNYDYSPYPNSQNLFEVFNKWVKTYKCNNCTMIHGDLVFTNILLDEFNNIKLIDMRGKIGNEYTIYGDPFYDFAKIYQSLIGYDFILNNMSVDKPYTNKLKEHFKRYIINRFGEISFEDIRVITKSLLFSLIPLHDDNKCQYYYNLINEV